MTLDRRQTIIAATAGSVALAALIVWGAQRRADTAARTPAWTDPHQPAEGVAVQPAMDWAASRPPTIAGACAGITAGAKVRRLYPGTLADDPTSFITGDC